MIRLASAALLALAACSEPTAPPDALDAAITGSDASTADAGCDRPCGTDCCTGNQVCDNGACKLCVPESDVELCTRLGRLCGELTAPDNCGAQRTVASCGGCEAGFACDLTQGACVDDCQHESDVEFCQRNSRDCGPLSADDNCGTGRTVADCGTCLAREICDAQGKCVDDCQRETDGEFCGRNSRQCGQFAGTDNCGTARIAADCGTCASGTNCDAQTGQCINGCAPETNAEFCARLGKACGVVAGKDNCDRDRTVIECGLCPTDKHCDANQCVPDCVPESNSEFCTRISGQCGWVTGTDNCYQARTADCGTCGPDKLCNAANNTCYDVCWTDPRFCQHFGAQCGLLNQVDNCGVNRTVDCGTCAVGEICSAATNTCQGCQPESDADFCARLGNDCGTVSGTDSCGLARTVASCGSCNASQSCLATNVCGVANDACSNAAVLTPYVGGKVIQAGTTKGATNDSSGSCGNLNGPDVVYSLTLSQASSVSVRVTRDAASYTFTPSFYIRSACGGGEVACAADVNGVSTGFLPNLAAGTYYVFVDGLVGASGGFNLEIDLGAPVQGLLGDSCANPAAVTLDPVTGTGEVTLDITAAKNDAAGSCSGSGGMDAVATFTLTAAKKVDVVVTPATGSALTPVLYVRSNCGETMTEYKCTFNSTPGGAASLSFPTLAAGTYSVWVDATTSTAKGAFTLKVTAVDPPPAPANDTCLQAEGLNFDSALVPPKATLTGADTTNAVNDGSGTCGIGNGPDLVYTFTTTQPQKVVAKVTRTTSTFEPMVYIRAVCDRPDASNEVTCAKHSSGVATATVNTLPAGTWNVVVDGVKGTSGVFKLEVTLEYPTVTGPANESCYAPGALAMAGPNITVQGTTVNAKNEAGGTCSSAAGLAPDVVYSVDVPRADQRIKATLTPTTSYAPVLYIRKACGSLYPTDEVACRQAGLGAAVTAAARNLDPGRYYIWIDGAAAAASGAFTLDVNVDVPVVPRNDDCAGAVPLTKGVPVTADTTDAEPTYGPTLSSACALANVAGRDLVFTFTPAMSGSFTVTVAPVGFDVVLWYSEAICGTAQCLAKADARQSNGSETLTINGAAGTTYYLYVDSATDASAGTFTITVQ